MNLLENPAVAVSVIDQLGFLKAEIAALVEQEKKLKKQLIDSGAGAHQGQFYDASVSLSERESLDMDAVRAKLSPQFIRAHTKVTPVVTVRVTARKGV